MTLWEKRILRLKRRIKQLWGRLWLSKSERKFECFCRRWESGAEWKYIKIKNEKFKMRNSKQATTNKPDLIKSIKVFQKLLDYSTKNTCLHEETHRGGTLWEICDRCGMKWADDKGGKPANAHEYPKEIEDAIDTLAEWKKYINNKL